MDILIGGAGSIGTVMGVVLSNKGHNVELLRRRGKSGTLDMGIAGIIEKTSTLYVSLGDQSSLKNVDFIFLTTQKQQSLPIIKSIRDNYDITQETIIIILQNGMNADKIVRDVFPNNNIILGVVWWSATQIDDQLTYYHRMAPTIIEHTSNDSVDQAIQKLLSDDFEIVQVQNINAEVRKKLLINIVSPVLALVKAPYPQGLSGQKVREITHIMYDEVLDMATKYNWEISDKKLDNFHNVLMNFEEIFKSTSIYTHKVSTQISAEKHGGKGSNAYELLAYFINHGVQSCAIVLEEVEKLQINYDKVSDNIIDDLLHKLRELKIQCKFI